jgi:hypothetical protein
MASSCHALVLVVRKERKGGVAGQPSTYTSNTARVRGKPTMTSLTRLRNMHCEMRDARSPYRVAMRAIKAWQLVRPNLASECRVGKGRRIGAEANIYTCSTHERIDIVRTTTSTTWPGNMHCRLHDSFESQVVVLLFCEWSYCFLHPSTAASIPNPLSATRPSSMSQIPSLSARYPMDHASAHH